MISLTPRDRIADIRRITPGRTAYAIYQSKGTSRVAAGRLSRDIAIDSTAPRGRLALMQRWEFAQGAQCDTSVLFLDLLEPISYRGSPV